MSDKIFCPRAVENGGGPDSPFKPPMNGEMRWRDDQTCSYCGSMSPSRFFELAESGAEVIPTDKNYKAYVRSERGQSKVYFQHFDDADKGRFIDLLNAKRMTLATPGYFYTSPFFCRPA